MSDISAPVCMGVYMSHLDEFVPPGDFVPLRDGWVCSECARCRTRRQTGSKRVVAAYNAHFGVTPEAGSLPHESAGPPVAAGDPKKPE